MKITTHPNFSGLRTSIIVAVLFLVSYSSKATIYLWAGGTSGGPYTTTTNWSPASPVGGPNGAGNSISFTFTSGSQTVAITGIPNGTSIDGVSTSSAGFTGTISLQSTSASNVMTLTNGLTAITLSGGNLSIGGGTTLTAITVNLTGVGSFASGHNLTISANSTLRMSGTTASLSVAGLMTVSGTFLPVTTLGTDHTTLIWQTTSSSVPASNATNPYYTLKIDKSSSTINLAGSVNISNQLWLNNGTLATSSNTITFFDGTTPIITANGGNLDASSGTLVFGITSHLGGTQFTFPNSVWKNSPQSIANLTINRTNPILMNTNQAVTITTALTLTAGVLDLNTETLAITGASGTPITRTSGTLTVGTGTLSLGISTTTTGTAITLPAGLFTSTSFSNLSIYRTSGVTLGDQDLSLAGTLALSTGKVTLGSTGARNIFLTNVGVVTLANSASYVIVTGTGQVQKQFKAGTGNFSYPVGDATNYSPIAFNFSFATYGTGTTNIGVNVTASKYSGVTSGNYINRYWTVTNNNVSTSMSYSLTGTYVAGDVQVPATEATLHSQRWVTGSLSDDMAAVNATTHVLSSSSNLTTFPATSIFTASYPACSALNSNTHGHYTIGGSSPDYAGFTDAIAALEGCGVSGPVIFDIRTGSYNTSNVSITPITGASSTNTITFESATGVNTDATLTAASGGGTLLFQSGPQYFTFQDMTISNTSASTINQFAVDMQGACANLTFDNCILSKSLNTGGSGTTYTIVNANQGTTTMMSNLIFRSCLFQNGGMGIYFVSSSSGSYRWTGVNVSSNTFTNQITTAIEMDWMAAVKVDSNTISTSGSGVGQYGIDIASSAGNHEVKENDITINGTNPLYAIFMSSSAGNHNVSNNTITDAGVGAGMYGIYFSSSAGNQTVTGNSISNTGSGTTTYGIKLNNSAGAHQILKNLVTATSGNLTYGISLSATAGGSSGSPALIANNRLQTTGATFTNANAGIEASSAWINIYFNSINVTASSNSSNTSTSAGCIYATGGSNLNIKNNICENQGSAGFGINMASTGYIASISNNDYYQPNGGTALGRISSNTYTSGTWGTGSGETGFVTVDPGYTSDTDLHASASGVNGAALAGLGITDDFDGDARDATHPDIGSDEFTSCSTPATPNVTVLSNNCGNSVLSTDATGGTLSWSTGATTSAITVTNSSTYTVTLTVAGGCNASGTGAGSPLSLPSTPSVSVSNFCVNSVLSTASAGSLSWSNGETTSAITVTDAATYSVTTNDGTCTSLLGTGTSASYGYPSAPSVSVSNICATSVLSTTAGGSLLWSTGATTSAITVTTAGTYSVTTTNGGGCTSTAGTGVSTAGLTLSGTYTIGGSSPDYATFSTAITDLICRGISGPVTFNVRQGTYTEHATFTAVVPGASAMNTIIFQSQAGTVTGDTLVSSSGGGVVVLKGGSKYITFRNMTISNTSNSTSQYAVDIQDSSGHNTLDNCLLIKVGTGAATSNLSVVNAVSSYVQANNSVKNCTIAGGAYGIYFSGGSSNLFTGIEIKKNVFSGPNVRGIELQYMDAAKIDSNRILGTTNPSSFIGILLGNSVNGSEMVNNAVVETGSGTIKRGIDIESSSGPHQLLKNRVYKSSGNGPNWGIYMAASGGASGSPVLIANNRITSNGGGTNKSNGGIHIEDGGYYNIYFNSLNLTASVAGGNDTILQGALHLSGSITAASVNIVNNIFVHKGTTSNAYALRVDANSSAINLISNNDYFIPNGASMVLLGGTAYSPSTWTEADFLNVDPSFSSDSVLAVSQILLDRAGATGTGVTDDYQGDLRCPDASCPGNASFPDIGADEFAGCTITTPSVTVADNCGYSSLSTTSTGALTWSTGETTSAITVTSAATYTVRTTVSGCRSDKGSGTTSPLTCGSGITFTVKAFLQGYYIGSGNMSPLLKLLNISAKPTDVDTVTIELHTTGSPTTSAYSYTGILQSNGNIVCAFDSNATGIDYYIVIKHRNTLTTYSAGTITMADGGSYDFTTGAGQAYGTGNTMANLGSGVYGIYTGDVNGDNAINAADKAALQSVLYSFQIGVYNVNDVTGDGFVDEDDLRILQNNAPLNLSVQHP